MKTKKLAKRNTLTNKAGLMLQESPEKKEHLKGENEDKDLKGEDDDDDEDNDDIYVDINIKKEIKPEIEPSQDLAQINH